MESFSEVAATLPAIYKVNHHFVAVPDTVAGHLKMFRPGDAVTVRIIRKNRMGGVTAVCLPGRPKYYWPDSGQASYGMPLEYLHAE